MGLGDEFEGDADTAIEHDPVDIPSQQEDVTTDTDALIATYEEWEEDIETIRLNGPEIEDPEAGYDLARELGEEGFAADAVYRFCDGEELEPYAGVFLSGIMAASPADRFALPSLPHVSRIGFRNDGYKLHVRGSAGDNVGQEMSEGVIHVEEDVGAMSGVMMEGGTLCIGGQDDGWLGRMMEDGDIVIDGEAQSLVGNEMEGGYIHARGGAHNRAGSGMKGGYLEIDGDARWGLAHEMEGGCLELHGEVSDEKRDVYEGQEKWDAGRDMSGGELYLQEPEPLDATCMGGDIYVANDEGGYDLHPEVV